MKSTRTYDKDGYPLYESIDPIPYLSTKDERLKFAFSVIEEHKEYTADFIYAAFRAAPTPEEMVRWDMISQLIEDILGAPLVISYNISDRLAKEGIHIDDDDLTSIKTIDPKFGN